MSRFDEDFEIQRDVTRSLERVLPLWDSSGPMTIYQNEYCSLISTLMRTLLKSAARVHEHYPAWPDEHVESERPEDV